MAGTRVRMFNSIAQAIKRTLGQPGGKLLSHPLMKGDDSSKDMAKKRFRVNDVHPELQKALEPVKPLMTPLSYAIHVSERNNNLSNAIKERKQNSKWF